MLQFRVSLTDDARVIIYDHNMFITQATAAIYRQNLALVSPYWHLVTGWG